MKRALEIGAGIGMCVVGGFYLVFIFPAYCLCHLAMGKPVWRRPR